uniref:DUF5050 domain-containing protein n=1 Tax=Steinernema glaseri TaxID=37863 RepID=A0A1I7XZA0_9BILA
MSLFLTMDITAGEAKVMKLTKLDLPCEENVWNPTAFTVIDGWLYYVSDREIRMRNLSTGEDKPLEIKGSAGFLVAPLSSVNGRLNVRFCSSYDDIWYLGELEFDATNRQVARFIREQSFED